MSAQLAFAEAGPAPLPTLSQWATPPALAAELVGLAAPFFADAMNRRFSPRVLEPSAGRGNLVRAVIERCPRALVSAVEIDERHRETLEGFGLTVAMVEICDYLVRPPRAQRYDVAITNPPFDGGEEGAHLAKLLDECERILALLPTRSFHGRERYERVWRRFDPRRADRDWWVRQRVQCVTRPKFGPDGGSDEIVLVDLRRAPGDCVERWL